MTTALLLFFAVFGTLFVLKMIYAVSVAVSIPVTQGALYVSTSGYRLKAFFDEISMTPDQVFIDIGCGDGRALRLASTRYGIKGVGYEVNPLAFLKATLLSLGHPKVRIRYSNFFNQDLSQADVVLCYLYPDVMKKVADKFRSELTTGTIVGSFNFELPGFVPQAILTPGNSLHNSPIYIYRI